MLTVPETVLSPTLLRSRATVADALRERARHRPDSLAYRFLLDGDAREDCLTYGALDRRARAVAATLADLGATGERVLLVFPPGLDFIAAWFGCAYARAIAVVVSPPHPARVGPFLARTAGLAHDAAPAVALTTTTLLAALRDAPLTPALRAAHWLATDGALDEPAGDSPAGPDGTDVAFLQYTSGSTSEPRGVMVTHDNLTHNLRAIVAAFYRPPDGHSVCWLPPWHDMGLIGGILAPLAVGLPATLLAPAAFVQRPRRWLAAISRHAAAISGAPNFAYELCVKKVAPEQRNGLDLSRWRCAFNGAEPVNPATLRAFAEHFAPCGLDARTLAPCYGLAESTLLVAAKPYFEMPRVRAFRRADLARDRAVPCDGRDPDAQPWASCGPPVEDVAIVADGRACANGVVGEIWVSGPSVAAGYWNRPDDSRRTFRAALPGAPRSLAYLRTGDLGFLLDGELFVTGRLKDLIIADGTNHYPQDIERTVERCHPALAQADCAALAVPAGGAEALVVVAALGHAPVAAEAAAITRAISAAVSEAHGLAVYDVVLVRAGSIPRTPSGKLRRHACRAAWLSRSLATWDRS